MYSRKASGVACEIISPEFYPPKSQTLRNNILLLGQKYLLKNTQANIRMEGKSSCKSSFFFFVWVHVKPKMIYHVVLRSLFQDIDRLRDGLSCSCYFSTSCSPVCSPFTFGIDYYFFSNSLFACWQDPCKIISETKPFKVPCGFGTPMSVALSVQLWTLQASTRASCSPRRVSRQSRRCGSAPREQRKTRSKWLQTSAAPQLHNFPFLLNALCGTFSAVHCEDRHTNNPYPTERNPPPGSRLEAVAATLLLWFVELGIFKWLLRISPCSSCRCSLPPTTVWGWVTLALIPLQRFSGLVISAEYMACHFSRGSQTAQQPWIPSAEPTREAACMCGAGGFRYREIL